MVASVATPRNRQTIRSLSPRKRPDRSRRAIHQICDPVKTHGCAVQRGKVEIAQLELIAHGGEAAIGVGVADAQFRRGELVFEFGDPEFAGVEDAGRQRGVHVGVEEDGGEMFHRARATRGHQRHAAKVAHGAQLLQVVTLAHAVGAHAVEHDLAGAQGLRLGHPVERAARQRAGAVGVAGVGAHAPLAVAVAQAVDADHHALHAEGLGQFIDQLGPLQRRRVP